MGKFKKSRWNSKIMFGGFCVWRVPQPSKIAKRLCQASRNIEESLTPPYWFPQCTPRTVAEFLARGIYPELAEGAPNENTATCISSFFWISQISLISGEILKLPQGLTGENSYLLPAQWTPYLSLQDTVAFIFSTCTRVEKLTPHLISLLGGITSVTLCLKRGTPSGW